MHFNFKIFFLCLILSCFTNTEAQVYNFRNYNTEHGLSQSQVLCAFQDSRGYMWFGTNSGGVSKFDGNKFYSINTSHGLINDVVFSITETPEGEIVFGTDKGISIYTQKKFKNFNHKNGLKNTTVFKLLAHKNDVWIGTQSGVYIYNAGNITAFNNDTILNSSSIWNIYIDKKENVWFGTLENGAICYIKKSKVFKHFNEKNGLSSNSVYSIDEKKNGDVLIGTQYGLNIIDQNFNTRKANEVQGNDNISIGCMLNDGDDNYYLGTQSEGIKKFNFNTKKIEYRFNLTNGLTNNPSLCMFKDREGNLWIGTNGSGIFKYYNNKFTYYSKTNGLTEGYINTVVQDLKGNIWIAMRNNGVLKIGDGITQAYTFKNGVSNTMPDNNTNAILPLPDGRILFGTADGLCELNNSTFHTITDNNFRHRFIISLFLDKKGLVWIGTNDGLFTLDKENRIKEVSEANKLKIEGNQFLILFINEDADGNIWVGTEKGVLCLKDGGGIFYNKENKFISNRVNNGICDSKGNMWFGTEEGVYFYNKKNFVKIDKQQGLPTTYINFLLLQKNKLYLGTNNGIDIININDFYSGKKATHHLGQDDGILNLESNSNAACVDHNGRLLIGTISGLEIYDPALDLPNNKEALLNITDINLFYGQEDIFKYADRSDSNAILPKNLTLLFSKNNLTFKFVGICFIAPEKVMYKYMLLGLDETWTPEVSKTEVTYSSLPPGTYTFMVKAMNNDGVWNKDAATYSFTILPPWYKTWWFYTLCVIVLFSGIFAYNTIKTKKLKADKQKLEKQVDERTKELREEKEKVEVINKEVIQQKALIENKNVEITDSIKYAKNIQEALLPPLIDTEKAFDNCFILYLPKDIVSGDFFWYSEHNNKQFIAAADCTGHGVPGAFMSIVGNNLLKEIINQKDISVPGDILLELHKGVKVALNQNNHDNERRDGMDIALCSYDKATGVLEYAGANRPLWIYRKDKDYELEVIKASKHPIGGLELGETREYTNHQVTVSKGDTIYIFSDGFADQFGGPRGKKFMVSNMQKLLLDNIDLPMPTQKKNISEAFKNWKDTLEQIDDVLVIGIRI